MNSSILKYFKFFLIIFILLSGTSIISVGQQTSSITVSGTVINSTDSKPIVGISVKIGTFSSSITDQNGKFSISVPDKDATLFLSGVGYQTKEVALKGRSELTIAMFNEGFKTYYGNVLMPMGSKSRTDITNSISTMKGIVSSPYESVDQLMDGEVSGMRTIMRSGVPGIGANMFIRGLNSLNASAQPLVVVDGMIMETNIFNNSLMDGHMYSPLSSIDVKDIASITVVKDAASIYGSKAGNGVILIESTRSEDVSTKIDFYVQGGINYRPKNIPMMNANQYKSFLVDQLATSNLYTDAELNLLPYLKENETFAEYVNYHNNTNWQDQVFKNSYSTDYYLRVTGGDDVANYGLSLGYMKHSGIVDNTNFSRLTTRFNANSYIAKRLLMKANMAVSYQNNLMRDDGMNARYSPIYTAMLKSPLLNPYVADNDGLFTLNYAGVDSIGKYSNPKALIDNTIGENKNYKLFGTIGLVYEFNKDLKLSTLFGVNFDRNRDNIFYPSTGIAFDITVNGDTTYRSSSTRVEQFFAVYNDTRLSYTKQVDVVHKFLFNLGARYNVNNYQNVYSLSGNASDDQFTALQSGNKLTFITNGNAGNWKWVSMYANVDYGFLNKYFLSFNMSMDGSSRFGKDVPDGIKLFSNKYGVFPSLGGSWLVSSEDFMKNLRAIDQLKLRLSYGLTGNDGIGNYIAQSYFISRRFMEGTGLVSGNLSNSQIQWEKTGKFNLGIDLGLLNERLFMSLDYFNNVTDRLLNVKTVNDVFGYYSFLNNDGKLKNSGIEFGLNARAVNSSSFSWDMGFNISTYKNEIVSLPGGTDKFDIAGVNATILNQVGSPIGLFYGYKTAGVYKTQAEAQSDGLIWVDPKGFQHPFRAGDMKFINVNSSDNIINQDDRVVIGNPNPDFTGMFSNLFSYKRFSLNVVFTFSKGNDIYNALRAKNESMVDYANQSSAVVNRWRVENQITNIPRADYGDPTGNSRFSDRWIEDGSYFRLKSLSFSYSPDLKVNFFKGITFFLTANNLFTFTKYLGFDPEVSMSGSSYLQGIDAGLTPQFRSVFAGFKLGL